MNRLVQLHSPHSGKPLPHARCWTSVVSIVPLKNNTDSSPGKPHISISCGQRETVHLQTSFSCQTALGHVFQGRWFIFSVGWLWGTHTCVPGRLQREGRQKTTSVSSCLCRHSDHGVDTSTATPGGQSAVGLFMFSSWDPPPQPPTGGSSPEFCPNLWLGLRETGWHLGFIWFPAYPPLSHPYATFFNHCRMQAAQRCFEDRAPNWGGGAIIPRPHLTYKNFALCAK